MLSVKEVKVKLGGKTDQWYFGFDRERWGIIVPKIKHRLLRDLWGITLWDRLLGRDIPKCDRCKNELLEVPRFILHYPLCAFCYGEYSADALNEIPDGYDYSDDYDNEEGEDYE
jgi:hypothetical protein